MFLAHDPPRGQLFQQQQSCLVLSPDWQMEGSLIVGTGKGTAPPQGMEVAGDWDP